MEPPSKPQQIVDRADEGWRFSPQKYANSMGKLAFLSAEVLSQIVWHLKLRDLLSFSYTCKGASELARCYIFYSISLMVPTKRIDLINWFCGDGADNKGLRGCVHQLEIKNSSFYDEKGFALQHSKGTFENGQKLVISQSQFYSNLIAKLPNLISLNWRTVYSLINTNILSSIQHSKIKYLQLSGFSLPEMESLENFTLNGLVSLVLSDIKAVDGSLLPFIKGILKGSHDTLEYLHLSKYGFNLTNLDFDLGGISFPKLRTFFNNLPLDTKTMESLVAPGNQISDFTLICRNANMLEWFKNTNGWDSLKKLRLEGVSLATKHLSFFLLGSPNIKILLLEDYFTITHITDFVESVGRLNNLETLKIMFQNIRELQFFPKLGIKKLWIGTNVPYEVDHTNLSEILGNLNLTHIIMEGDQMAQANRFLRGRQPAMTEERKLELLRSAVAYHCDSWKDLEFAYFGKYPMKVVKDEGVLLGINPQKDKGLTPKIKEIFGYPDRRIKEDKQSQYYYGR